VHALRDEQSNIKRGGKDVARKIETIQRDLNQIKEALG